MRGLTHYLSGMAAATFFPTLLSDIVNGNLLPLVAAASAYMPDFVDFKIHKFLERWKYEIDPAPPDPKKKYAPRLVNVKDIDLSKHRYSLLAVKGIVKDVAVVSQERTVFVIDDGTGSITIEAVNEDCEKLLRRFSTIKPGMEVTIAGYIDADDNGSIKVVVSDAPHPQGIADAIAKIIDEAYETGEDIRVKLHLIRMPGDVYRRYLIHFKPAEREIEVYMGPLVTVGGIPIEGTDVPEYRKVGRAKTKHPFIKTYPKPTVIDAFSGPSIAFRREKQDTGEEAVEEAFIPWHREWSHSITAAFFFAAGIWAVMFAIGYQHALDLAIASFIGYCLHIFEDQLGFMGSVLLPPITKKRIPGLMLGESGSALMNFSTAWLMLALMGWNFYRFTPGIQLPWLSEWQLLAYAITPSLIGYAVALAKGIPQRKRIKQMLKYYQNIEAFEELEEVGTI